MSVFEFTLTRIVLYVNIDHNLITCHLCPVTKTRVLIYTDTNLCVL